MAIQGNPIKDLPRGFPVTKESAEQVYCGLGKNWWKQLYDGKYHRFGHEVFDKGLHVPGVAEPGYYESGLKAFEFAKRHLNEKLSVEFYCNLHKEACAHFKGAENGTRIEALDTSRFRNAESRGVRCKFNISDFPNIFDRNNSERKNELIIEYSELRNYFEGDVVNRFKEEYENDGSKKWKDPIIKCYSITPGEVEEIENLVHNKIRALQETLDSMEEDPVLEDTAPSIALQNDLLVMNYAEPKIHGFSFDEVISHLFETFNQNLAKMDEEIVSSEQGKIDNLVQKKLILIDDLYQKLEWLHPFPDGQGRTDLLLLAKLLSENGFTPAILDEPYMSSYSSRDEWVAYQKEGMQKWQEEKKSINFKND